MDGGLPAQLLVAGSEALTQLLNTGNRRGLNVAVLRGGVGAATHEQFVDRREGRQGHVGQHVMCEVVAVVWGWSSRPRELSARCAYRTARSLLRARVVGQLAQHADGVERGGAWGQPQPRQARCRPRGG